MKSDNLYTNQLQAGLGLIKETRTLLDLWENQMTPTELHSKALNSGEFSDKTSRRIKNIINECFKPRYLINDGIPALHLKKLMPKIDDQVFIQFHFLFTCRANLILADFISNIYWDLYAGGYDHIHNQHAQNFILDSLDEGKTEKRWEESTIKRQTSYLMGCCVDFGLLERGRGDSKQIKPFYLSDTLKLYLSYELHLSGLSDNAVLSHKDWSLFGFKSSDVINELKILSQKGFLMIQSGGGITTMSWKNFNMEELCDVIN